MVKVYNERVPHDKLKVFHELLCATGGRYLSTPREDSDHVLIDYTPGNDAAFSAAWARAITPIREVRRDQLWRRCLRRVGLRI